MKSMTSMAATFALALLTVASGRCDPPDVEDLQKQIDALKQENKRLAAELDQLKDDQARAEAVARDFLKPALAGSYLRLDGLPKGLVEKDYKPQWEAKDPHVIDGLPRTPKVPGV